MKIKALSIRQPYAERILTGEKVEEYRSWCPAYRGPLLVHASKSKSEEGWDGLPLGCLVGLVHFGEAFWSEDESYLIWDLRSPIRFAEPIPYKGAVGLMSVPLEIVRAQLPDKLPRCYRKWAQTLSGTASRSTPTR